MKEKPMIVFLTGAGISKPSGIPTFREEDNGLWNNNPIDEVATLSAYHRSPKSVISFFNELQVSFSDKKPNHAHIEISKLEKHYNVFVITQNIDDFHEQAGSTNVIHLHGKFNEVKCLNCQHIFSKVGEIHYTEDHCPKCFSIHIKHNIILFQEGLNEVLFEESKKVIHDADLFVQIGTSDLVSPANKLIKKALPRRKRVEMNLTKTSRNPFVFQHYYLGDIIKTIDEFILDIPKLLPISNRKNFIHKGILKDKERYSNVKIFKNIK